MMKLKKFKLSILFGILLLIIILIGCTNTNKEVLNIDYRSGTDSITMSFVKGLPPEKIFVGETFTLGIDLENKGASDIIGGIIILSGYESKQFNFPEGNAKNFELKGKSQYQSTGEKAPITFQITSLCYPEMASNELNSAKISLRATACYSYSTTSPATVCIDTNQLSSSSVQEKICDASKTIAISGGQGGPIEITKIEPTMIPIEGGVKARFAIYLKNSNSKGLVYSSTAVGSHCEDPTLSNKVSVNVELSGMKMSCNVDELKLVMGRDTPIYCEKLLNDLGGVYEANMVITTSYAYSQDVSREITISKPSGVTFENC